MNDISGRTSGRQFAFYDRDSSSWRMWPATGLWGSIEFSETWPKTGSMSGGRAFEHLTSAPPTIGKDCSSSRHLPTVRAANGEGRNNTVWYRPDGKPQNLENAIARVPSVVEMLPTPLVSDASGNGTKSDVTTRNSPQMRSIGYMLPTPTAREGKTSDTPVEWSRNSPALGAVSHHFPTPSAADGSGGKYNATGHQSSLPGTVRELPVTAHFPTPLTTDAKGPGRHGTGGLDLRTTVTSVFPTPTASDGTGGGQHPSRRVGRTKQLIDTVLGLSGDPTLPLFDVGNE